MSGARFNPPPNWPVPPGWTPPRNWEPDPAWPPAPQGWRFWVPEVAEVPHLEQQPWAPKPAFGDAEPTGKPAKSGSRRRAGIIVGAVALAVALIAGAVGVVSWLTDSPLDSTRAAGMLPGTYPDKPEVAWRFRRSAGAPESKIATPLYRAAFYAGPGAIVADGHVIVHTTLGESETAELVSLRLSDGEVEWSKPAHLSDGCSRELLGDLLVCQAAQATGAPGRVEFIDVNNGAVRATATLPFRVSVLASDGQYLYTGGYGDDFVLVVAKGTVDDPMSEWRVTVPAGHCASMGSGDGADLQVRDGLVWGYDGGGAYAALRAADGSPIFDAPVTNVSVRSGPLITAQRCQPGFDFDSWATDVVDSAGTLLFTSKPFLITPPLEVAAGAPVPLLTRDGVGLDPATGQELWRLPNWPRTTWVRTSAVVGNAVIWQAGDSDTVVAGALDRGANLWTASPASIGDYPLTDGVNVLGVVDGQLIARSLADGARQWSSALTDSPKQSVRTYATDAGLLYVTAAEIGLLPPTGPAVSVPRFGADGSEQEPGGTELVTPCGTPPVFQPQVIDVDSDALVITMKVIAKCPGGDVLSAPRTKITVSADGQNIAAGIFDLSSQPIVISSGSGGSQTEPSVSHEFRFPKGSFWRIPVSLREAPDRGSAQRGPVDLAPSTLNVECEPDGARAEPARPMANPAGGSSTAIDAGHPKTGDDESASFDALRAIANADRPFVTERLADRWVPQLSSKRPGLVADGVVWNNAETLREHLDLRLRYPEVRLLWSGDWSTFSAGDFWVTIAGVTFPAAEDALAWCRGHGFSRDHCYAKLVSTTHPIEGSTALNK